jgi:hypothetical protein
MRKIEGMPGTRSWLAGARVALLLLAAGTLGLHAEQDKDKDKNRDKKPEPARHAPASQPKAEPRREAAPRPAESNRPAPAARPEARSEPRRDVRPETPNTRESYG